MIAATPASRATHTAPRDATASAAGTAPQHRAARPQRARRAWRAKPLSQLCYPERAAQAVRLVVAALALVSAAGAVGCGQLAYRLTNPAPQTYVPNPMELPPAEDTFVWLQVIDVVDDYFRIARERPVRNRPELVLDGYLETIYRPGSSIFEPWRKDSTSGFERLQSTLQSIRRRAIVQVHPQQDGYVVEVVVQKDLEDTDRSQYATESAASTRHDGTIMRQSDPQRNSPRTLGWIPLGRDTSLEQAILRDIYARITEPDTPHGLLH